MFSFFVNNLIETNKELYNSNKDYSNYEDKIRIEES